MGYGHPTREDMMQAGATAGERAGTVINEISTELGFDDPGAAALAENAAEQAAFDAFVTAWYESGSVAIASDAACEAACVVVADTYRAQHIKNCRLN